MKGNTARSSDLDVTPPFREINDLGVFGAMALLAMIQCGADPGYRYVRRLPARAARLAPHRALRHQILVALLECGVLVPAAERRLRLDAALADPGWDLAELEDADWAIGVRPRYVQEPITGFENHRSFSCLGDKFPPYAASGKSPSKGSGIRSASIR